MGGALPGPDGGIEEVQRLRGGDRPGTAKSILKYINKQKYTNLYTISDLLKSVIYNYRIRLNETQ